MNQALENMDSLFVVVEDLAVDAYALTVSDLAEIANMHLQREHRKVAPRRIVGADTQGFEHAVGRAIEEHLIVGEVQMAIIVDPMRLDGHDRGPDRRHAVASAGIVLSLAHNRQFDTVMDETATAEVRRMP